MDIQSAGILTVLIFATALLYSATGHGGGSGYLAAMALFGLAPGVMRPTALALNVLVSTIALTKYFRAGYFSWPLFWPLALASVPLAFLGGKLSLPALAYKPLVGCILLYAGWRLITRPASSRHSHQPPPFLLAVLAGAIIGLLAGLTGVGGGVFLSPLLLAVGWGEIRLVSGVTAAFILANSLAGILGVLSTTTQLPEALPFWAAAAGLGAFIGSELGSRQLGGLALQRILAAILVLAGLRLASML